MDINKVIEKYLDSDINTSRKAHSFLLTMKNYAIPYIYQN